MKKRILHTKLGSGRFVDSGFACIVIAIIVCAMTMLLSQACAQEVENGYGRQRGRDHADSVNGTGGFARLFEIRGHTVATWRKLSPRLDKFDTIVWFPDRFDPPSQEEVDKLDEWLSNGSSRTLIFIGRDFDAEVDYWTKIMPQATPEEKPEYQRRKANAETRHATRRSQMSEDAKCEWFELDPKAPPRRVSSLQGEWARDVDASKVDITLNTRMKPLLDQRTIYTRMGSRDLLSSNGDAIVTEITDDRNWPGNKLILVSNGSFLLNVPLVNTENRKLAGLLIDECAAGGEVVFLESDENGAPIVENKRDEQSGRMGQWMFIWPLNLMLFHFFVIGIIFFFTYVPMFGRPKEAEEDSTSDFGKHVESLGQLVRRTGDQKYALSRIEHYQEHVKRETGARNIH